MATKFLQFQPWEPDTSAYISAGDKELNNQPDPYNAYPVAGGAYKARAVEIEESSTTSVTTATTIASSFAAQNGNDIHHFAADSSALYHMDTSSNHVTDQSKGGGYTVASGKGRHFTQYGRYVITVSGGESSDDPPQVYDMSTAAAFADLGGSPPNARAVATLRDFVVMGNTYDATDGQRPNRVWWSGFGNHEDWTPSATTQCDFQDLNSDFGAVVQIVGGNEAFIICENGIVIMEYVGPPTIMNFHYNHYGVGATTDLGGVRANGRLYLWSTAGFVSVGNQTGDVVNIGEGRVDESFALNVGVGLVPSVHDQRTASVIWQQKTNAGYAYSYKYDNWWPVLNAGQTAFHTSKSKTSGKYAGETVFFFAEIGGNDLKLYAWSDLFDTDNFRVATGYIQLEPGKRSLVNRVRPLWEWGTATFQPSIDVYKLDNYSDTPNYYANTGTAATYTASVEGTLPMLEESRFHKFVFYTKDLAGEGTTHSNQKMLGLEVDYDPTSRF